MTEWQPQIVKIEKIEKHPNADTLSIYTILGDYPVIDKTGKYQVEDLASYIPIDSICPDTEEYHFLTPRSFENYEENGQVKQRCIGYKYTVGLTPEHRRIVKAKKFFGKYSQGLLMLPIPGLNVGDSIIQSIGLKKVEEENEENIPGPKKIRGANAERPPKGWEIPYYDIEGIRKYLNCFLPDEEIVLLEKINGSNSGFCHDGNKLVVKSRNYYKKQDELDMWWAAAFKYDLENKLSKYPMMVFFAECAGQVKSFRYNAQIINGKLEHKLFFFDVYDIKNMRYLDYEESLAIIKNVGLEPAPELYKGKWTRKEDMYLYAEGTTLLGGKHVREGWVMKPLKERYEPKLDGRWQGKLIGEGYALQK